MKNIHDILRQAVMVLSVLSLVISSGGTLAQNSWQQQQQQQRQQEENRRQQDQMRQQQAQQAQAEANRRAEEQRQRQQEQARFQQQQAQQQQEQMRRQQEESRRQQAQAEASRRAMADEQRKRETQADASRRAMEEQRRRDTLAVQTKNEQEKQRQQIQNAQKAQLAGKPAPAGTPQTIANRASDRMVFSNGVAKLTRPLTPAEMKRGFTGKVTEDGRALVKFQNRIFAVPATRLGITPRETSTSPAALATSWSPQKQSAINADIEKLASGASSGPGTAAKGEPVKVASVQTPSRTDAARAARSGGGGGGQEPPANKAQEGSVAAKGIGKVGPATDRAGNQIGRIVVDSKGNAMIEPVGGRTVAAGKGGVDTHTLYPNGSNYQRLNPQGHANNPTPHGHGHALGTGPGMKGQGASLDVHGNVVPSNSPAAHWPIN